jgi:superfamily I DNA and/or RNA helicase
MVDAELKRLAQRRGGRPIARRLTEQYRMHPAIARIVSHCFYDDELITNRQKEKKFLSTPPPFLSTNATRLSERPIVFIDMPYCREEAPGGRAGDRPPPWSNPEEVDAAMTALQLLRLRDASDPTSLAILSPYRQQVTALRRKLERQMDGSLAHIRSFTPAVDGNDFCGTVDSFQGGEADLVLISLVRNNTHSTPSKALGFLRDNRRMNVLLSRAKWRLILIGSLSFYRHIVATSTSIPDQDVGFLAKFLEALKAAEDTEDAAIVSLAALRGSPA